MGGPPQVQLNKLKEKEITTMLVYLSSTKGQLYSYLNWYSLKTFISFTRRTTSLNSLINVGRKYSTFTIQGQSYRDKTAYTSPSLDFHLRNYIRYVVAVRRQNMTFDSQVRLHFQLLYCEAKELWIVRLVLQDNLLQI